MPEDLEKEAENKDEAPSEEVAEIMENNDLDKEEAEHVQEIMEEHGLSEEEAVELADDL